MIGGTTYHALFIDLPKYPTRIFNQIVAKKLSQLSSMFTTILCTTIPRAHFPPLLAPTARMVCSQWALPLLVHCHRSPTYIYIYSVCLSRRGLELSGVWEVLADNNGVNSMNVTAIDTVEDGFNLSLEAMDTLTNGHAKEFGVVSAQATVSKSYCGL